MILDPFCNDSESTLVDEPVTLLEKVFPEEKRQPNKVILLAGPTAVGKTDLSLKLAEAIGGEIISADSVQSYIGADIGTAKASIEERLRVPHHLIDISLPSEQLNVFEYYHKAQKCIKEILDRGSVPIIVGGAGFYLRTLIEGPPEAPPGDHNVRKMLEKEVESLGIESLYERLEEIDPQYAQSITCRDKQKIIRGLEIIVLTKKTVSSFKKNKKTITSPYFYRSWFLFRPREVLYDRVETRCQEMIDQGFLDEVRDLLSKGMEQNRSLCMAIGYRQAMEFLNSDQSPKDFEHFVSSFIQVTKQYVKRQFTWFRKEEDFRWLNLELFPQPKLMQLIAEDYYFN